MPAVCISAASGATAKEEAPVALAAAEKMRDSATTHPKCGADEALLLFIWLYWKLLCPVMLLSLSVELNTPFGRLPHLPV